MARLIVKSPYIKCNGGGGHGAGRYVSYIGTRERVELLPDDRPPTRKQQQLVRDLVRDFPDTKSFVQYADYSSQPTKAHASSFLTAALETHWDDVQKSEVYMRYIATRPRAERLGSHGLFGDEDYVNLCAAMDELDHYTGNVWTHIISLKREDAERLGYDNAKAWRNLLRAHRNEIATAMHIPPNDFRWYAAFHDEGDHPHVHMMAWSVKPGQAYLSPKGIAEIKSALANDVFRHEMTQLYKQKSTSRDTLVREARHALMELAREIQRGIAVAPEIEDQMQTLAQTLGTVKGKHKYGYLTKPVKRQVDKIVDELENFSIVSECYDRWLELQNQVDSYYKDEKRRRLKLSEQKEFRSVKNAVIAIADQIRMGTLTFEDKEMRDEPDEFPQASSAYHRLRSAILDMEVPLDIRDECIEELKQLAEDGEHYAQYFLGKLYRDGGVVIPDDEQAEKCFRHSAEAGYDCAAYALGKLLQEQGRMEEAAGWYERAAMQRNEFARYRLAKLYLTGSGVPKDVSRAVELLEASAEHGNPHAEYLLGKLYLDGALVPQDVALGIAYMERSARQGNAYAQLFVDRRDSLRPPSVMLSVTRLFQRMGQIFQDNSLPQSGPAQLCLDRKRMQELIKQKGYQAARNYARGLQEEQQYNQTMTTPW